MGALGHGAAGHCVSSSDTSYLLARSFIVSRSQSPYIGVLCFFLGTRERELDRFFPQRERYHQLSELPLWLRLDLSASQTTASRASPPPCSSFLATGPSSCPGQVVKTPSGGRSFAGDRTFLERLFEQ